MNEQAEIAKRDWKVAQIEEYARLEEEVTATKRDMTTDIGLNKLIQNRLEIDAVIKFAKGPYLTNIEAAQQQQAGIKAELQDRWYSEDKTFECAVGTATLRVNKSLNIRSKEKLIEFLTKINKLPDFIKSFEITKLRKIKDAGMLEDEIATWDEKKTIAIKIAEVEQWA